MNIKIILTFIVAVTHTYCQASQLDQSPYTHSNSPSRNKSTADLLTLVFNNQATPDSDVSISIPDHTTNHDSAINTGENTPMLSQDENAEKTGKCSLHYDKKIVLLPFVTLIAGAALTCYFAFFAPHDL